MHAYLAPAVGDLVGLVAYVLAHPHLFISSSTVMTSGLLVTAIAASAAMPLRPAVRRIAPALALVLAYFGAGSMLLAAEIALRFHAVIPVESGIQLASGAGHIAGAALGVAFLGPLLRGHSRRTWLAAHFAALVYWTAHVALLTPPWFAFQGQGEIVTLAALLALGLATVTNACVWVRSAAAG